jgi:hypothetical protein
MLESEFYQVTVAFSRTFRASSVHCSARDNRFESLRITGLVWVSVSVSMFEKLNKISTESGTHKPLEVCYNHPPKNSIKYSSKYANSTQNNLINLPPKTHQPNYLPLTSLALFLNASFSIIHSLPSAPSPFQPPTTASINAAANSSTLIEGKRLKTAGVNIEPSFASTSAGRAMMGSKLSGCGAL